MSRNTSSMGKHERGPSHGKTINATGNSGNSSGGSGRLLSNLKKLGSSSAKNQNLSTLQISEPMDPVHLQPPIAFQSSSDNHSFGPMSPRLKHQNSETSLQSSSSNQQPLSKTTTYASVNNGTLSTLEGRSARAQYESQMTSLQSSPNSLAHSPSRNTNSFSSRRSSASNEFNELATQYTQQTSAAAQSIYSYSMGTSNLHRFMGPDGKIKIEKPADNREVQEMFDDLMEKRDFHSLPSHAQQQLQSYSVDKKWLLVQQDLQAELRKLNKKYKDKNTGVKHSQNPSTLGPSTSSLYTHKKSYSNQNNNVSLAPLTTQQASSSSNDINYLPKNSYTQNSMGTAGQRKMTSQSVPSPNKLHPAHSNHIINGNQSIYKSNTRNISSGTLHSPEPSQLSPAYYVRRLISDQLTNSQLNDLWISLRTQPLDWVLAFLDAQGHVAISNVLLKFYKLNYTTTPTSATLRAESLSSDQLDTESLLFKCLKTILNLREGANECAGSKLLMNAIAEGLLSLRIATRRSATEMLTFIMAWQNGKHYSNVLGALDQESPVSSNVHIQARLISPNKRKSFLMDNLRAQMQISDNHKMKRIEEWLLVLEYTLDGRGAMGSMVGASDEIKNGGENALLEYCYLTMFMINKLCNTPSNVHQRTLLRSRFKTYGFGRIMQKLELLNYEKLNNELRIFEDKTADDYTELISDSNLTEEVDMENPVELLSTMWSNYKDTDAGKHLISLMQHVFLTTAKNRKNSDLSDMNKTLKLIDGLVSNATMSSLDVESSFNMAIQRLYDSMQTDEVARRAILETRELTRKYEEIKAENDNLTEKLEKAEDGLVGKLQRDINERDRVLEKNQRVTESLQKELDYLKRQMILEKHNHEVEKKNLISSGNTPVLPFEETFATPNPINPDRIKAIEAVLQRKPGKLSRLDPGHKPVSTHPSVAMALSKSATPPKEPNARLKALRSRMEDIEKEARILEGTNFSDYDRPPVTKTNYQSKPQDGSPEKIAIVEKLDKLKNMLSHIQNESNDISKFNADSRVNDLLKRQKGVALKLLMDLEKKFGSTLDLDSQTKNMVDSLMTHSSDDSTLDPVALQLKLDGLNQLLLELNKKVTFLEQPSPRATTSSVSSSSSESSSEDEEEEEKEGNSGSRIPDTAFLSNLSEKYAYLSAETGKNTSTMNVRGSQYYRKAFMQRLKKSNTGHLLSQDTSQPSAALNDYAKTNENESPESDYNTSQLSGHDNATIASDSVDTETLHTINSKAGETSTIRSIATTERSNNDASMVETATGLSLPPPPPPPVPVFTPNGIQKPLVGPTTKQGVSKLDLSNFSHNEQQNPLNVSGSAVLPPPPPPPPIFTPNGIKVSPGTLLQPPASPTGLFVIPSAEAENAALTPKGAVPPPPPPPPPPPGFGSPVGGGPPPPPPPFMMKPNTMFNSPVPDSNDGNGSSLFQKYPRPKRKMKQLHWEKIDDAEDSFWKNQKPKKYADDLYGKGALAKLESAFAAKEIKKLASRRKEDLDKITFLSRDVSQQFGINLHAFASLSTTELVKKVLNCDKEFLNSVSVIEFLSKSEICTVSVNLARNYAPYMTDWESVSKVEEAKPPEKDITELQRPDQVYVSLMVNLQSYWFSRMRAITLLTSFEKEYSDLVVKLRKIDRAVDSIKNSDNLKGVFDVILAVGNFMNDSSKQAKGFKLSTLQRLTFIKDEKNKLTFLNYVEIIVRENYPELLDFVKDLEPVLEVVKISIEQLDHDCTEYCNFVKNVTQSIEIGNLSDSSKFHPWDRVLQKVLPVLPEAKKKAELIHNEIKLSIMEFETLMRTFGEDVTDRFAKNSFFSKFADFVNEFKKCQQYNIKLEEEERAYEKRKKLVEEQQKHQAAKQKQATDKSESQENETADDAAGDDRDVMDKLLNKLKTTTTNKSDSASARVRARARKKLSDMNSHSRSPSNILDNFKDEASLTKSGGSIVYSPESHKITPSDAVRQSPTPANASKIALGTSDEEESGDISNRAKSLLDEIRGNQERDGRRHSSSDTERRKLRQMHRKSRSDAASNKLRFYHNSADDLHEVSESDVAQLQEQSEGDNRENDDLSSVNRDEQTAEEDDPTVLGELAKLSEKPIEETGSKALKQNDEFFDAVDSSSA
ncbi:Protein BNI1 [Hanseniaspora osmophila]|uniref:Protein BNI1 n=1 Tax=Hanseniaspora osmophila TaxID=56408 RepID=A0A1E5RHI8_9ASCO|nr:Protein BNI1 [Hanseniaspora osmophila]